jgi:hypothetical protein
LFSNNYSYSGIISNVVPPKGFSSGFAISLDSIWTDTISNLSVEAEVMYMNKDVNNNLLTISLENSQNADFWETRKLDIPSNEWNKAFAIKGLSKKIHSKGLLKVYVWNPNKTKGSVFIDDLRVTFKVK